MAASSGLSHSSHSEPHRRAPAVTSGPAPGASRAGDGAPASPPWLRRVLQVPLLGKLIVADLLINLIAVVMVQQADPRYVNEIMIVSLVTTLLLNAALVYWALLPLKGLESTAVRVSQGNLDARVRPTLLADRNITRIGQTLNQLLDGVTADRARMRLLASQVISAGDQERALIARELHDSTAQSLSALELLLTAALRDHGLITEERLRVMHEIVTETLAEVRTLSHNVHPRVLDDLGLVAAIEWLARRTREQSGVETRVASDVGATLPMPVASVLYRVAQEAVRNATRHAAPKTIQITITGDEREARLEVTDDGCGFDPPAAKARRNGMGLFIMRERVALVDGDLEIVSRAGHGTTVLATVPLTGAAA
jgi:signal transduction histidine kinase